MIIRNIRTRMTLGKLSKIANFKGKRLIEKFFNRELPRLREKTTIQELIRSAEQNESTVNQFAALILKNSENAKLFEDSIKLITNHAETKKNGLFYKTIYQNGLEIDQKDYSKVKAFLLARNDTDIVDDEEDVDDADKTFRRKKSSHIFEKLQSDRIVSILKVYIALVLWRYVQLKQKAESSEIKKRLVESAQTPAKPKTSSYMPGRSIDTITVSSGQREAFYNALRQSSSSGDPLVEFTDDNKSTQYYLNSYMLQNGNNHYDETVYCAQLLSQWRELKINSTFEIEKYVCCILNINDLSKMRNIDAVFKINISENDRALIPPGGAGTAIIPSHTKFKALKIETIEYECTGDNGESLRKPIVLKKPTITVEIIKQKDPTIPTDSELDDMIAESYVKSKKDQNDQWNKLIQNPDTVVFHNEGQREHGRKQGIANTTIVRGESPGVSAYLNLIAQLQRNQMTDDDIHALFLYTGSPSAAQRFNKWETLNNIFEKIKPLTRSLVVFRSMDKDEFEAIHQSYIDHKPFSGFVECAPADNPFLLSTSVEPACALEYLQQEVTQAKGKGLLKLTIPSGKRALVAEPTAQSPTDNREIVLQRSGLSIKVDKETPTDKLLFIEATVL